jgi:hypothetical protein
MKQFEFEIPHYLEDRFFKPIRKFDDYVLCVLQASQFMLQNLRTNNARNNSAYLIMRIDKMKRLIFGKDNKYYSILYPFSVREEDDQLVLYSQDGTVLNSAYLSTAISLIESDTQEDNYDEEYLFLLEFGQSILEIVRQSEPSYLRFDIDPENENGKIHPKVHLDINFSTSGTYKLGLNAEISCSSFYDILDLNSDCAFLDTT